MRRHQTWKYVLSTTASLALFVACVGGPGQLPGEDGQQNLPSGSGSGTGSANGSSSSSSGASSTPANPGRPPQVDPPVALPDASVPKPVDAGKDSSTVACTNTGQTSKFEPVACQTCLEQQCCTQLRSCFSITASPSALNCNQYNDCLNDCVDAADPAGCQADCNSVAATGVTSAYNNIITCAQQKCLTPCQ
jgi:hypothetical protein